MTATSLASRQNGKMCHSAAADQRVAAMRLGRSVMPGMKIVLSVALGLSIVPAAVHGQASLPNPYRAIDNWAKLPEGVKMGQTISVDIDRDGKSIWVFERCGATSCDASKM